LLAFLLFPLLLVALLLLAFLLFPLLLVALLSLTFLLIPLLLIAFLLLACLLFPLLFLLLTGLPKYRSCGNQRQRHANQEHSHSFVLLTKGLGN
jgi:hypothetical protein